MTQFELDHHHTAILEQCWKDQYMWGKLQIMEHHTRVKQSQMLLLLFISANSTHKLITSEAK